MKTFKRILASILLISTIIGFGFLAGATISRLYDRITGGVIDADHDDAEFDAIINELNGHTAAVAPHTGQVKTVGDTMTGNLIMDGADVRIYDGNDLKLYSDGGTTLKASIDGATGDADIEGGFDVAGNIITAGTVKTKGAGAGSATIQYDNSANSRTVTIPDPGSAANFVMTEGPQTVNGAKTFGTVPTLPTTTRYYIVSPTSFVGATVANTCILMSSSAQSASATAATILVAPINLPNGAIVTNVAFYFYRDDAASSIEAVLYRDAIGSLSTDIMCDLTAASTAGFANMNTSVITDPTIDNTSYVYSAKVLIDNNNSVDDTQFKALKISYTVATPLP